MLLSFLLPVVIFLIAYLALGIAPYGDQGAMIIDSYHQYVPFFSELHDKIWHGDSILYSWHGSLGFNFVAAGAYYLASPLNILLALFPDNCMVEAFETLIILKIGLAGLAMYLYLRRRNDRSDYAAVIFADFYALGGFSVAYNWNVMWLDSFALFPLIILGLEKLIDDRDGRIYTITLGLAIFCNYYIGIMICIFLVLYALVYWFTKRRYGAKAFFGDGMRFAFCSLIGGGLAAVTLIPTYFAMTNASQGSPPSGWKLYRNFLEVFRQHFAMVEPTQLTGAPNIYCGLAVALLAAFFLFSRRFKWDEKLVRIALTAFLLISTNVNVLDYVWHGFHFPNNLPGRFSFIYIFLMVQLAWDAFQSLRDIRLPVYAGVFAAGAALFASGILVPDKKLPVYTLIVSGILLAVYAVLLIAHKKEWHLNIKGHRLYPVHLLLLLMTAELAANGIYGLCMNGSVTRTSYMSHDAAMRQIRKAYDPGDETFYRMEIAQMQGRDDIMRYHLNGLSYFSSTNDDRLEKFVGALGFFNAGNKFSYKGATPLTDAILGFRYIVSKGEMSQPGENLTEIDEILEHKIYENCYPLSVGFVADRQLSDWRFVEGEPFSVQNDFAHQAADVGEDLFTPVYVWDPETEDLEITGTDEDRWKYKKAGDADGKMIFDLSFEDTADIYLYFEASHCKNLKVVRGEKSETFSDKLGHIVHLGMCGPDTDISLEFTPDDDHETGSVKLQMCAWHQDVFEEVYDRLDDSQWIINKASSRSLQGILDAKKDGLLMLSIPYDLGWKITVDGAKVDQEPVGEGVMGIPVTAGEHEIRMAYFPKGLGPGLAFSGAALAVWIIMMLRQRKKLKK